MEEVWPRLLRGESGVAPLRRFDASRLSASVAATLPELDALEGRDAIELLAAPTLKTLPELSPDTPLLWTGIKGSAQAIETGSSRHRALACEDRRWAQGVLGIRGEGLEINAACASSTVGVALAAAYIRSGIYRSAVVAGADWVSRFVFTGFAALRALSPTRCLPFDKRRDGLVLGDGAVALLLESQEEALRTGRTPLAEVAGWGIANDANHITGPARDGRGLATAIRAALAVAGEGSGRRTGAFCAHGTGTPFNDAMELEALAAVFGPRDFPLFSVKGALGHSLGAVGGIEVALCARALAEGRIPPTAGLEEPEPAASHRVSATPQTFSGELLTTNSGFGGSNAALILRRPS